MVISGNARFPLFLLALFLAALAWSAVAPADRLTWLLEVLPALMALPLLVLSFRRLPLTPMLYVLIFLHALVLLMGGHYTYAKVPFGFWMQETFDFSRNHYDRIGHFFQGFEPAILAREILIRRHVVTRGGWLVFLCIAICLGFSAFYELIEWWTALAGGQAADAFLGTQGDPWDTQWDMCFALIGACMALLLLSAWHDRQLRRLGA